ncbi:23S rRNA (uracil(1939)-C(5))-methyltransferase RlmD [Uliginosibacterium sp. H3]|uniref:23S rRNA (uracil(1939)-C(5))-methyltransferase RlmD n=1 Tax=Uliginosibacterium silvisoli TaxID=3114758 RepID=A0ABU6K2R3_9RHOO|nr:23S rRNA (uracil(1939)-C(5))-methyltransferase RlmD [Uliginosibacterium sp. H3]
MSVATIESLDHEGRGIAHVEGKAIFIEGALPGETVEYSSYRKRERFEQATTTRVIKHSAQRAEPRCKFFDLCGGCSLQHAELGAQVAAKQRVMEDALKHIGKVPVGSIYPPIYGPAWGYRYRGRIGIRMVPSKGGVLIGFHEKKSSYIVDMTSCEVLPPHVSDVLIPLRRLIASLSSPDRIPQVELAVGDDRTVLVLRNLLPFTAKDKALLLAFGEQHALHMWQQPGAPETARPLRAGEPDHLYFTLPEFNLALKFKPTDFTQVNVHINRLLVRRAMQLLQPQPGERIADLFCGLGNFTLPIARSGARVVGVEGSAALVERAAENARENGLSDLADFSVANLFEVTPESLRALGALDKMLIDPPREGAIALVKALGDDAPRRIVYVSCNPATLARDAAVLVREKGYVMRGAGVANMFPHTSHVESIALFERL